MNQAQAFYSRLAHISLHLVLIGLLFSGPVMGQGMSQDNRGEPPSEIKGTVRVNGCMVDASHITIQAVPMGVTSSDGRRFTPDPRAAVRGARVEGTENPYLFRFSVRGLHPATVYRLAISYPPNPCDKVFWRGPMDGLAVSGGPAVEIEGLVARTEVELLQTGTDEWVGADDLQFTDPVAGLRKLRWRSTLPGVTGGELQISTEAFPTSGRSGSCGEPPAGVIFRAPLRASVGRGEWAEVDIDFNALLTPGRIGPSRTDAIQGEESTVSDATYQRLVAGAPLFVRVVPSTDSGRACNTETDGVHGWVVLAKLPKKFSDPVPPEPGLDLQAWQNQMYTPPFLKGAQLKKPTYNDVSYKVTKAHPLPPDPKKMGIGQSLYWQSIDPLGWTLVKIGYYNPGVTLQPGASFSFTPSSTGGGGGGLVSFFTSYGTWLVTTGFGAIGDAVTYAANLAEEIKKGVAEVVVDVMTIVPGIGPACAALQSSFGTSCEEMVQAGMEYGMASMGIPPSLPNWDELKDQGIEYLASEIASEIEKKTGVPSSLTEDQLKELAKTTISEMTKKRGSSNGPQYDWVIPYFGYDPAVWTMTVKKNIGGPLPPNLYIRTKASSLYQSNQVRLPIRFPASGVLRIPVVLQPDFEAIPVPYCRRTLAQGVVCTPNPFLKKPVCETEYYDSQGVHTFSTNCEGLNWTSVYYRDHWAARVNASACITLEGVSYADAGGLWLYSPSPPLLDLAVVSPTSLASWDGPFHVDFACK